MHVQVVNDQHYHILNDTKAYLALPCLLYYTCMTDNMIIQYFHKDYIRIIINTRPRAFWITKKVTETRA